MRGLVDLTEGKRTVLSTARRVFRSLLNVRSSGATYYMSHHRDNEKNEADPEDQSHQTNCDLCDPTVTQQASYQGDQEEYKR